MRTYIYTATDSTVHDMDIYISVYRIKKNFPHFVGDSNYQRKAWRGYTSSACAIIHNIDGIPYAKRRDGTTDRYRLKDMLYFADMHDTTSGPGIRLFSV